MSRHLQADVNAAVRGARSKSCRRALGTTVLAFTLSSGTGVSAQAFDTSLVERLRELKSLCTEDLLGPEVCTEMQRRLLELDTVPPRPELALAEPTSVPGTRATPPSVVEFRHAAGFSIALPAGWTSIDQENLQTGLEFLKKNWPGEQLDTEQIEALESALKAAETGTFKRPGATLVVRPQSAALQTTPSEVESMCGRITDRLSVNRERTMYECGLRKMEELDTLYIEHDALAEGRRTMMHLVTFGPSHSIQFVMDSEVRELAARKSELEGIITSTRWE